MEEKKEESKMEEQKEKITEKDKEQSAFVPVHIFMQYWDGEDLVDGIKK